MALEKKMPNVSHYPETSTPSTPPAGYVALWAADNTIKIKNEAGETLDLADLRIEVLQSTSTGLYAWTAPGLAINTDATKVNVSAGQGHIVNYHDDPSNPTYTEVSWIAQTITIAAVASVGITYLLVNSAGTITQQTSDPTPEQRRENIFLGRAVHTGTGGVVIQVLPTPDVITTPANQLHELMDVLGILNQNVRVTNNGANLKLNLVGGNLLARGAGYISNRANPNEVTISSASPKSFAYITQLAGSAGASVTDVVPGSYDVAGTTTAIPGSTLRASNQRVYIFPSGAMRVAYGQAWYNNLSEAIQGIATESFTINPSIGGNGVLVAVLSLTKGCTNLGDTATARILPASRFGETAVGGSGTSVTTLQQAYTNSDTGKITTDGTRLAVDIQGGTGTNTDKSLQFLTNAGVVTLAIDANGLITGATISHSQNTVTIGAYATKVLSSDAIAAGTDRNIRVSAQTGVTDDIQTINTSPAATVGEILHLHATSGHTITVKHGLGNIYLRSLGDETLNEIYPIVLKFNDSSNWIQVNG